MQKYVNKKVVSVCIATVLLCGAAHQVYGDIVGSATKTFSRAKKTVTGTTAKVEQDISREVGSIKDQLAQAQAELAAAQKKAEDAVAQVERYAKAVGGVADQILVLIKSYEQGGKNIESSMERFVQKVGKTNVVGGIQELFVTVGQVPIWFDETMAVVMKINEDLVRPLANKGAAEIDTALNQVNIEVAKAVKIIRDLKVANVCS